MSSSSPQAKEVKVFATAMDADTLVSTVLVQPSLYMAFANMALMVMSQRFPEEFLPPSMVHKRYNGVRMTRLTAAPFCTAAMLYLAAASMASTPTPVGGHLAGFTTSMVLAAGFMSARKVSWYYPLLSIMYFTFGSFHHYRKMKMFSCNAPVYRYGDATEIWRHWRGQKKKEKEDRRKRKEELKSLTRSE
jgi:hypothetical protein